MTNQFKIGSLIIGNDPNKQAYCNDIGIILDKMRNSTYHIYWFRYWQPDGDLINYSSYWPSPTINACYKVLK